MIVIIVIIIMTGRVGENETRSVLAAFCGSAGRIVHKSGSIWDVFVFVLNFPKMRTRINPKRAFIINTARNIVCLQDFSTV